jgi:hypothetical protein
MSCLTLLKIRETVTNLFGDSLHRPINQLGGVGQQLWCRPLVDPCSRESLKVKSCLRNQWTAGDGGEDVGNVVHRVLSGNACELTLVLAGNAGWPAKR